MDRTKVQRDGMNLHKKTIHIVSLQRNREDTKDKWYLTLNKSGKNGLVKLRSDFRAAVSIKIVHTASQGKKLKSLFLHENIGDGISLQAHRGGTFLNGIGNELIRIF